jgi:site-specific DNA-methyltransferase (adenine-specific)
MSDMMKPEEYRNQLLFGNSYEVLKRIPSNVVSAVVTDPPYGLSAQPDMREVLKNWLAGNEYEHGAKGFMGREWDSFVPGPKIWTEIMRVLKPGGHILSFSGTRTYDLMVTAMRIAGCEVRDKIDYYCEQTSALAWCHGQGFPKSLDIQKAMEKTIVDAIEKQGIEFTGWEDET